MKRKHLILSLFLVLLLVGCAKQSPAPAPPATPTSTAIQSIAILSSANLAAAQSTVALHKSGTVADADYRALMSYYGSVDMLCYQSKTILASSRTDAEKYAELSVLASSIILPKVTTPEVQAQLSAIAASTALLIQSVQRLKP
ncbi:MAG: hypothetical protein ABFD89_28085 [Bryobacteraceae bacterium]